MFGSGPVGSLASRLVLLVVLVGGCAGRSSPGAVEQAARHYLTKTPDDLRILTAAALLKRMNGSVASRQIIVDLRTAREHAVGHIPGAIHVPLRAAADPEQLRRLSRRETVVLVCKSGHTASMVNAIYNMLGIRALTLKHGMLGWRDAGGDLEPGHGHGSARLQ